MKRLSFEETVNLIRHYAFYTLDSNGVITSWNSGAEHIFGWKQREALGKKYSLTYGPEDVAEGKPELIIATTHAAGYFEIEGMRMRKDGTAFLADVTVTQIRNDDDTTGYIEVVKDISAQKKAADDQLDDNIALRREIDRRKKIERDLEASNNDLEAFASAASHDLQEPLRMVVSYLQLIEKRYSDKLDEDGLEFLNFAKDGATRMKALINDLVVYSRLDTLAKPHKMVDADALLSQVLSNLSPAISESGATVTSDRLPQVWSDEVQLTQLFQNLISNALKYRRPNVKLAIHIGVTQNDDHFVFHVSDNGKGINKKHTEVIFLIFKQLESRAYRNGSGVGLAIVKKIVTRHGGEVWVKSTEGKGSDFMFSIPRH